jgi:phage minor structural protein
MIHVIDEKTDEILAVLSEKDFWGDEYEANLKNVEVFRFTMPANHPKGEHFTVRKKIIIPWNEEYKEFILNEPIVYKNTKEIHTIGSFVDLRKQKIIDPTTLEGYTPSTAGQFVLEGTGWELGIVEYTGIRTVVFEDPIDAYNAIKKVAKLFGLEVNFRVETKGGKVVARYVDLVVRRGELSGKEVTFRKDLEGLERREVAGDLVTALKCYGPVREDGTRLMVIVEDQEAYQKWNEEGRLLWGKYEPQTDDKDMTEDRLRSLGETELAKRVNPQINYTLKTVALEHVYGYEHEKVRLGDTNRVKDESKNPPIYLEARVISEKGSIKQKARKEVEYGDPKEYSKDEVQAEWKKIQSQWNKKIAQLHPLYVWVMYADDSEGNGITNIPESKPYIGFAYNKKTQTPSSNPADYEWSKNEGEKGPQGPNIVDTNTSFGDGYDPSTKETPIEAQKKADQAETNAKNAVANGEVPLPAGSLEGEVDLSTTTLNNANSTIYTDAQGNFYFIDPDDTKKVLMISSKGIGLSENGLLGPFRTSMTGAGMVADLINVGTMRFERLRGGTLTLGGPNNGNGIQRVLDENGESIYELNAGDIGSSYMNIGVINSPSVLRVQQYALTLYVNDATGNDLNDGKTASTPFKTIQAALNSIPKYLKGSVTIEVATDTYNEEVLVIGFTGIGDLNINLNKCGINGRLLLQNCSNIVRVKGQDFNYHAKIGTVNPNYPISIVTCQYVILESVWGKANNRADYAIYVAASNVYTYHCVHERAVVAGMGTTIGANLYAYAGRGSGNKYSAQAAGGSKIHMEERRPAYSTGSASQITGGGVTQSSGITTVYSPGDSGSSGTSNPEPITVQQGTLLKTSVSCLSWDDRYGWKSGNNLYQGEWMSYGNHRGLMYFPSMQAELSGKTIKSVRLYMTRADRGGSSASSKLFFYLHNYSSQPSGMPALGAYLGALGSYARTEPKWINLPISVGEAMRDGTAKGLAIYSASGDPYVIMNPAVQIEVKYEG